MSMKPGATMWPCASMRCFARSVVQCAARGDGRDAVAVDADVAVRPGIPGAVDDAAVLDHDVVVGPARAGGE